jgi:hypothetical protein
MNLGSFCPLEKHWHILTPLDMIVIDEKFPVIKEINGYLVDMILINSFRSGGDVGGRFRIVIVILGILKVEKRRKLVFIANQKLDHHF